jgi:hypothetical protein
MAIILFTMRDVERSYAEFEVDLDPFKPAGGVLAVIPKPVPPKPVPPKTASKMIQDASRQASTYLKRTARGALITVKKGARRARRALAKNKIAQSVDRAAGNLIVDTGKAVSEAGSHIGRNKGKYALGAAALGVAGAGAYYLMNRRERNASYSRHPRTVYFSRR